MGNYLQNKKVGALTAANGRAPERTHGVGSMSTSEPQSTKPASGRRILRISDVARLCEVSKRTVYNWMQGGTVQWTTGPGNRRYIYADSIPLFDDLLVTYYEGR
jgi:hypothetical protein